MILAGRKPSPLPSIEVSTAELEEIAFTSGAVLDLPGARAGWAYCVVPGGRRYRSWLNAPGVASVVAGAA